MLYDAMIVLALWMLTLFIGVAIHNGAVSGAIVQTILFLELFGFFTYFWVWRGQTIGMLAWDLRVETQSGEPMRLNASTANRRILIGLSDGAPVDDATLTHNDDPALLWRHYQQAVAETEAAADVTLAVMAIRYERRFVQRRTKLDTVDEVADLALPFVADLITHR